MKRICKRTGIELESVLSTNSSFGLILAADIHPLFLLNTNAILEVAAKKEDLFLFNEEEQSLLILSLLDSMQLIQWNENFTAKPSYPQLIPALERILRITALASQVRMKVEAGSLPRICISSPQDCMEGIIGFLDSILLEIGGYRIATNDLLASQMLRIEALVRSSKGDEKRTQQLRASCCAWVIESIKHKFKEERVTTDTIGHWKQLLKASPQEVVEQATAAVDIAELEDFLLDHLPLGSTASYEVLNHIGLLKQAAGSLSSYLRGGMGVAGSLADKNASLDIEPEFIPRGAMPQKKDYKQVADWLTALKLWNEVSRMPREVRATQSQSQEESELEEESEELNKGELE